MQQEAVALAIWDILSWVMFPLKFHERENVKLKEPLICCNLFIVRKKNQSFLKILNVFPHVSFYLFASFFFSILVIGMLHRQIENFNQSLRKACINA